LIYKKNKTRRIATNPERDAENSVMAAAPPADRVVSRCGSGLWETVFNADALRASVDNAVVAA